MPVWFPPKLLPLTLFSALLSKRQSLSMSHLSSCTFSPFSTPHLEWSPDVEWGEVQIACWDSEELRGPVGCVEREIAGTTLKFVWMPLSAIWCNVQFGTWHFKWNLHFPDERDLGRVEFEGVLHLKPYLTAWINSPLFGRWADSCSLLVPSFNNHADFLQPRTISYATITNLRSSVCVRAQCTIMLPSTLARPRFLYFGTSCECTSRSIAEVPLQKRIHIYIFKNTDSNLSGPHPPHNSHISKNISKSVRDLWWFQGFYLFHLFEFSRQKKHWKKISLVKVQYLLCSWRGRMRKSCSTRNCISYQISVK